MFSCCSSRNPKTTRYLTYNTTHWAASTKSLSPPSENKIQIEVDYVSLTFYDKQKISQHEVVGYCFSGRVKAVGSSYIDSDFKKGDKVCGFITNDITGAMSEFVDAYPFELHKLPSGVSLEVGSCIFLVWFVVYQLRDKIKEGSQVRHSGFENGFYQSLLEEVVAQNKAFLNQMGVPDLLFVTEALSEETLTAKESKETEVWSIAAGMYSGVGEEKVLEGIEHFPTKALKNFEKIAGDSRNVEILKKIRFEKSEVVRDRVDLENGLFNIETGKRVGPIVVRIDVLKGFVEK